VQRSNGTVHWRDGRPWASAKKKGESAESSNMSEAARPDSMRTAPFSWTGELGREAATAYSSRSA